MHFLFKKEEKIEDKKEEKKEDDKKEPEEIEPKKDEDKEQEDEEEIKDTSDNRISDDRDDIISGVKNINKLVIKAFRELTQTTIEKLTKEVVTNPNYKKNVKEKYEEYKNDITQIVGIINNYEIEQLTRTYDSLGTKGRPKMAYNPEELTTFDERIEEIVLKEKGEYEFIPGYQFIKNESLNSFIDLFKAGKVNPRIANTIVKMVAYSEVVCNRFIDYIYLSIQNYLYDDLTNKEMIKFLRNEMHKSLLYMNFEDCKKLLEISREISDEIKTCRNNIKKLNDSKDAIEKAHNKFYEDELEEKEPKPNEEINNNDNENENENEDDDNKNEDNNFENEGN